jgi:hypothetical protein
VRSAQRCLPHLLAMLEGAVKSPIDLGSFMLDHDQKAVVLKSFGDCNIDDLIAWVLSTGFDPGRYLSDYVDLKKAGFDIDSALCHF